MKKLIALTLVFMLLGVPVYGARLDPITVTEIDEDGDIIFDDPGYTRDNSDSYIGIKESTDQRGYLEFNITELWDKKVTGVSFHYKRGSYPILHYDAIKVYAMANQPSSASDATLYADCGDGTNYATLPAGDETPTWYTIDLGEDAASDLATAADANQTWFALGLTCGAGDSARIESSESSDDPTLIIYYYESGDAEYVFSGHFYENGTDAGAIDVTASFPTISSQEFEVDGSTTMHFEEHPTLFMFTVGSYTRNIYGIGEDENFTLLTPYDTYAIYEFTIKDYIGKIGEGDSYLETYTTVNGTETLVERMIINDAVYTAPVTLQTGQVYHLKILWEDGTRYTWGYWVAGSDTTPTIAVRDPQFSDQIQATYKYLRVSTSRDNTTITVDYEDTLGETDNVSISIALRNGTVSHTDSSTDSDHVFNWNGANSTLDYKVTIFIQHQTFNNKTVVQYADAEADFDTFIDEEVLGSYGLLNTGNLIAFSIVAFFFGAFTFEFGSTAGIFVGLGIASALTFWGVATWSYNLLALCWFVGILAILRGVRG